MWPALTPGDRCPAGGPWALPPTSGAFHCDGSGLEVAGQDKAVSATGKADCGIVWPPWETWESVGRACPRGCGTNGPREARVSLCVAGPVWDRLWPDALSGPWPPGLQEAASGFSPVSEATCRWIGFDLCPAASLTGTVTSGRPWSASLLSPGSLQCGADSCPHAIHGAPCHPGLCRPLTHHRGRCVSGWLGPRTRPARPLQPCVGAAG